MAEFNWIPRPRDYTSEGSRYARELLVAHKHPLQRKEAPSATVIVRGKGKTRPEKGDKGGGSVTSAVAIDPLSDPLSSGSQLTGTSVIDDPLSAASMASTTSGPVPLSFVPKGEDTEDAPVGERGLTWDAMRVEILSNYTLTGTISVTQWVTKATIEGPGVSSTSSGRGKAAQGSKPVDRTKSRMAQLDESPDDEREKQVQQMTQEQYTSHLRFLNQELIAAWDSDERVQALKIAIQCAKMLGDVSVPQFYPSAVVLVTDTLETFGKLVYDRIRQKGVVYDPVVGGLPKTISSDAFFDEAFDLSSISAEARETCTNWLYKVASIRELLPRFFVEVAVVACYRFLYGQSKFANILMRLAQTARGLGDPLVAAYARMYLVRKGIEVAPAERSYLLTTFSDCFSLFHHLSKPQDHSGPEAFNLYSPALEWILYCIGKKSTKESFNEIIQSYKDSINLAVVLRHIISSFEAEHVTANALAIVQLIKESDESVPRADLFIAFGEKLGQCPPPKEQRLQVLNEVWKVVSKLEDPEQYTRVVEVYIDFVVRHFSMREVNVLLKDLLKHVTVNKAFERVISRLQNIMERIVREYSDFGAILGMDGFMPLMDLFQSDSKYGACKILLDVFTKNQAPTDDLVIIHTMFDIARSLHDALDSLSFEDERRQVSRLICKYMEKIDFGKDVEQQLNFYRECREAFSNLEHVQDRLVHAVSALAMKTHRLVGGRHTKRTAVFVKACLAFCHITIPSIESILLRLHLFLLGGQVALVNGMVTQCEAFLKAAITLIADAAQGTDPSSAAFRNREETLLTFLDSFVSFLIVVPGHPEQGPFYLVNGLINVLEEYTWSASDVKLRVYFKLLHLFSTYYQMKFPYSIPLVDSNDTLYGSTDTYRTEVRTILNRLLEEILVLMAKVVEEKDGKRKQGMAALDLFNFLITSAEINASSAKLAVNLFLLSRKSGAVDSAYAKHSLHHVKNLAGASYQELYRKLASV